MELLIDKILTEIEKKFGKTLVITSKKRTAEKQAAAMYPHFETNSDTLRSYASHKSEMLKEIKAAYDGGKKAMASSKDTIASMQKVIESQVKQNKLISNHLSDSARDIRTNDLTAQEIKDLLILLKNNADIVVLNETKTSQPHIHVHLK